MLRKISSLFYVFRQGLANILHNKLFSLASVATITACLFMFGAFYAVVTNFQHMVMKVEEGVSVTVFFHSEYDLCYIAEGFEHREEYIHPDGQIPTAERLEEIGREIEAREEVSGVKFISDDEAWADFGKEHFGDDYASGYEENPLRGEDNYEVYLSDVSMQDSLVTWLRSLPEVRRVNYDEATATTLTGTNLIIAYVSAGIIALLFAVSIFLISNTVAMGISVRREEISIMRLIGAKDFVVRSPFVIEGILIGLIGSALPLVAIYYLYKLMMEYATTNFAVLSDMLKFMSVEELFRNLVPVSLILGVGIGFLGSLITVRRHLKV